MKNNKKSTTSDHKFSKGVITGIGAGVATLAVFLYGTKEGRKEREKLKGWMVAMKGEIIRKLENLKNVNKEHYHKAVDEASKKFGKVKGLSIKEISKLSKSLKSKWEEVKKEAENLKGKRK